MVCRLSPAQAQEFMALLRERVREVIREDRQRCSLVRVVHLIREILVRDMREWGTGTHALPRPDPDRKILKI